MAESIENPTIKLMEPVPDERLRAWLHEFYGKDVSIKKRDVLRHRDFSYVERIQLEDALPESLIYKLVIPPWDIEQDLHERVLVPSISSSAQLYMTAHYGAITALFLEDLGTEYLTEHATAEIAKTFGEDLAKMHRSYTYRIEEIIDSGIMRNLKAEDIEPFTEELVNNLNKLDSLKDEQVSLLKKAAQVCASKLQDEPPTLVHGDLYAENIVLRNKHLYLFDWSWFTSISIALVDLASMISDHPKNGLFREFKDEFTEAYCFESGRTKEEVVSLAPYAATVERLLFLKWLEERKSRGVLGTTVGHVDGLIDTVINQVKEKVES